MFWALVDVCTLVLGLRKDLAVLRLAGLALLGVTVAKVFLFDLATLTSMYRVVSFVGLGVLLLAGAFIWQRLRPRALPQICARRRPGCAEPAPRRQGKPQDRVQPAGQAAW